MSIKRACTISGPICSLRSVTIKKRLFGRERCHNRFETRIAA